MLIPTGFFLAYMSHSFAAIPHKLGMNMKLGAITQTGIVEAFSRGTKQIGLQFHIEYGYFKEVNNKVNRQKIIIDNFLNLVHEFYEIKKNSNLTKVDLNSRIKISDQFILSKIENCVKQGMSPVVNNFNDKKYSQCLIDSNKYHEQYLKIINTGFLEDINMIGASLFSYE